MKFTKNIFKNSGIRSLTEDKDSFFKKFMYIWFTPKNKFFTKANTSLLALTIGMYFRKKHGTILNVLIGCDTRTSGSWIKPLFMKSIKGFGHNIFDAHIVPTPLIAHTIKHYKDPKNNLPFFQLGIIITASHNPAEYNGIKLITPDGYLTLEDEIEISKLFYKIQKNTLIMLPYCGFGSIESFDCIEFYEKSIQKTLQLTYSHVKILLDCANGATTHIAKKIFQHYYPNLITINDDGRGELINNNSGCSNPELLIQAMQQHHADWGCAFDGDGDRVIIAHKNGSIFDGDDILVVLSQHPTFAQNTTFVGTIMTNNAIEQYFKDQHKTFLRTDVGERNIICALDQHHAQLGSEACGHITVMNHARCSDGIFTALLFFETIFLNPEILEKLPKKFSQLHATIPLKKIRSTDHEIDVLIQKTNTTIHPGRIIIRKSNTEPVMRLTVEHPNEHVALNIFNHIKEIISHPL